jgi:hypothetical protein
MGLLSSPFACVSATHPSDNYKNSQECEKATSNYTLLYVIAMSSVGPRGWGEEAIASMCYWLSYEFASSPRPQ